MNDKAREWMAEPNEKFLPAKDGIEALIMRSTWYGGLCGYIGVPEGHPAYENRSVWEEVDDVHGGWTRFDADNFLTRTKKGLYWVGFDCNHSGDYKPYRDDEAGDPESYRNMEFVTAELERVRDRLLEMTAAPAP